MLETILCALPPFMIGLSVTYLLGRLLLYVIGKLSKRQAILDNNCSQGHWMGVHDYCFLCQSSDRHVQMLTAHRLELIQKIGEGITLEELVAIQQRMRQEMDALLEWEERELKKYLDEAAP